MEEVERKAWVGKKMQNKKNKRKKKMDKEIRLDEFLREDDLFDEEDEDQVTDDTLEFLILDDEAIESYQRKAAKHASAGKKTASQNKKRHKMDSRKKIEDGQHYESGEEEYDRYYAAGEEFEEAYNEPGEEEYEEDDRYYADDSESEEDYYEPEEEEYEEEDGYYADDGEEPEEDYYESEEEEYEEDDGYYDTEEYDEEAYYESEEDEYEIDGEEYDRASDEDGFEYYEIEGEEDDYDEDEYDEYDEEEGGVFVRLKDFLMDMSTLDLVVAVLGVVVLAGVLVTGGIYINAKSVERQAQGFASVGEQVEGISVIGESGLVAVAESARLGSMVDMEEQIQEEEPEEEEEQEPEEDQDKTVEVDLKLTSIQSDLKIKFVNKSTGKLIGGVPFEIEVAGGKKTMEWKDENKDGIIYHTEVPAGEYSVSVKPLEGSEYADYKLPTSASSVKVTDTIAYKKVEVADEVKTEAEVNAAAEDTAVQNTVVESALKDTVEWVESTKTPVGDEKDVYEEIDKKNIPDPWTVSSAYRKFVELGKTAISGNDVNQGGGNQDNNKPGDNNQGNTNPGDNQGTTNPGGGQGNDNSGSNQGGSNPGGSQGTNPGGSTAQPFKAELAQQSMELKKGDSTSLSVKVTAGSLASTGWKSNNDAVAAVDGSGKVTAKEVGTAVITATVTSNDNQKLDLTCTVNVKSTDGKVTISGETQVAIGQTITLTVQTEPKDRKVTWSSDNDKIAKVDEKGVVTGVAEGEANIKAACTDAPDIAATYKITVKKALDGAAKLKDKDGNQMYYLDSSGAYKEATYDDYKKYDKFFKKSSEASAYKYTGWQTIDGHVYFYDKEGNYVTGEQIIQGAKYNFGSDGKMSNGSGSMGIDVSKWNGSIDWNAVKNSGVSYVIIRCGYRGSSTGALIEDPKFRSNIKGAKAAGLKVGVYFFSQAVNEVEAVEEASMAINLASGYGLSYPIFLDVEPSGGRGDGIGKDVRTEVCRAFCATVQNSGYSAGIYANKTWLNEKINTGSLTNYKIWLAQYASAPTYSATRYDMWQYSSKGKVSGISGDVDMNISYMHY